MIGSLSVISKIFKAFQEMKIGILQTDSVREKFQAEFGDYPDMFMQLLKDASNAPLTIEIYDVIANQFPKNIDDCDAYLITGSRFSVYEDLDWIHRLRDFVVELDVARKKLIGICFGHQLIALALGGKAELAQVGWGVGVHTSAVTKTASFMEPKLSQFTALVSHQDQVTELPEGAECLASSDFCPFSMIRIGNHILTFQGHPEFHRDYSKALIEMRQDILGDRVYTEGLESLSKKTNEDILAQWIMAFCAS